MSYRIGIDAGSKTIKVVVIDQDGKVVHQIYRRHRSNIIQTLKEALHDLQWMSGGFEGPVAFTGSAGIGIAEELGAPFVQEVIATTTAVQETYPQTDVVIELGGEDAKIIYLTGGIEQRMNASCAGGTGGFIDTIAFMLGVRSKDMDRLAYGCRHIYPIASRCAVFAQTDIRPLINAGASKADLAGSAFQAVVRQTLGGLACGRPIRGNVVFLGGPLEYNNSLVAMFRKELNLNNSSGIKPEDAHLFTARGAAYFAGTTKDDQLDVKELAQRLEQMDTLKDDLERLPPLFQNEEDIQAFKTRHEAQTYPHGKIFETRGPLFLGVDAGSTTVKVAVVDLEGKLVYQQYEQTGGDTSKTLRDMLLDLYERMPKPYTKDGEPVAWIERAVVTGYGEDMIRALFGVDAGVVETAAHLRAAQEVCPDVTFILDIGGQDMKALWVKDGVIVDAVLNEACSSGCGSFIEGTAYSLRSTPIGFSEMALTAKDPVDLGTRCTVFMTSRVRHAQKIGTALDDIAAGIAYSVVQNALYRIIGAERVSSMGDHIVVQGGTFKSDAVLRAFELISGREVTRSDRAHLMGAIGCALIARDQAEEMKANGSLKPSSFVSFEQMKAMKFERSSLTCPGCNNACPLSMIRASDDQIYISGNRCEKGPREFKQKKAKLFHAASARSANPDKQDINQRTKDKQVAQEQTEGQPVQDVHDEPPNIFTIEQRLLNAYTGTHVGTHRARVNVGLMNALELYGTIPFWYGVLHSLGFTVTIDVPSANDVGKSAAWETIPSESVCYPAKLSHLRYFNLTQQKVDAVFMPQFERNSHCIVASSYAQALADNLGEETVPLIAPVLSSYKPRALANDPENRALIKQALDSLALEAGAELNSSEVEQALQVGFVEQEEYDEQIKQATRDALKWLEEDPARRGVVLAGRSYHGDPAVSKGIDKELQKLSIAVFSMRGLNLVLRDQRGEQGQQKFKPLDPNAWKAAKRLASVADYVVTNPQMDLVCLQSFGCGYDAISFEEVRDTLETANRPFTILKIDDITDLAHIRIRLRTLVNALKARGLTDDISSNQYESDDHAGSHSDKEPTDGEREKSTNALSFSNALFDRDLSLVRRCTVKDACFTAQSMAAHAIDALEANPTIDTIELPLVCQDCEFNAVPNMIEHATGKHLNVKWVDVAELSEAARATAKSTEDDKRPRIGIIGNALMCYQPALNDNLVNLLDSLGIQAVLPDPVLIQVENVRYEEQLAQYEKAGITEVIYVQSFGCLKEHVQARGSLHRLKKQFPGLNITVIDYDPESSALNRENRIRLVAESLKRSLA